MGTEEDASGQVERVKRFYDRNTARFQRLGEGGTSIHRAVWAPGVATLEEAFLEGTRAVQDFTAGAPTQP